MKSRLLNAAAVLICFVGAFYIFQGIWALVATEGFAKMWAEMMGETLTISPIF